MEVRIKRIILYWGLYRGPLILGNCHLPFESGLLSTLPSRESWGPVEDTMQGEVFVGMRLHHPHHSQ